MEQKSEKTSNCSGNEATNDGVMTINPEWYFTPTDIKERTIKGKFCLQPKFNHKLFALVHNEDGSMQLPAVFNIKEDAEFYLSFMDKDSKEEAIINITDEAQFSEHGAVLLVPKAESKEKILAKRGDAKNGTKV